MSGEKDTLPPKEWLENRIEQTINHKGQIEAQYRTEKDRGIYGMSGPYSWFDYLVGELLQVYRMLEIHENELQDHFDAQRKRWRKLLGLSEDAKTEEVEKRLLEARGYYESRGMLLRLLGLQPDSTQQEMTEAIDDVAPLIADYRRKKRGT